MTSTKNSLGLPMAEWKDSLEAVSSGGTEQRSRGGGAPAGLGVWRVAEPGEGRAPCEAPMMWGCWGAIMGF